jgi:hypothetical protein
VISGRNSPEQLIVASNDVAASTAQLVAASRVKATFMSKTQDRLEQASKAVGAACRGLVRQVQEIIKQKARDEGEAVDYGGLSGHEFKIREMEQQVSLLTCVLLMWVYGNAMCFADCFVCARLRFFSWKTILRLRGAGWERCGRLVTWRIRRRELPVAPREDGRKEASGVNGMNRSEPDRRKAEQGELRCHATLISCLLDSSSLDGRSTVEGDVVRWSVVYV